MKLGRGFLGIKCLRRKSLLETYKKLHSMSFGLARLQILHGIVIDIRVENSFEPETAIEKFIEDIRDNYDSVLGFERKIKEQKEQISKNEQKIKDLELERSQQRELLDNLQNLINRGVKATEIIAYSTILNECKSTPQEFYNELKQHRDLTLFLTSKKEELSELDDKILRREDGHAALEGEIQELGRTKERLEGEIRSMQEIATELMRSVNNTEKETIESLKTFLRNVENLIKLSTNDTRKETQNTLDSILNTAVEATVRINRLKALYPLVELLHSSTGKKEEVYPTMFVVLMSFKNFLEFERNLTLVNQTKSLTEAIGQEMGMDSLIL